MLPVVEREVPLRVTRHVQHLELPIVAQPDSLPAREADVHLPRLARVRRRIGIEADVVLFPKKVVAAVIKRARGLDPSADGFPPPPPPPRPQGPDCGLSP